VNSSRLPEVVMTPHARYLIDPAKVGGGGKNPAYRGKNVVGWLPMRALAGSGLVQPIGPAMWMSPGTPGLGGVCYYGHAEVYSEKEQTLWVGINVNNHGKLWLNNRLVWVSPPYDNPDVEHRTYTFPVAFRQGLNSLLFRCDNETSGMYFDVRICVRGKPRDAAGVAAHRAALEKAQAALPSITAGVRGWRGDMTGRWPEARPPLAWDPANGINVLWQTTLPEYSHATPVIAGDRIFTPFEPHYLACVRKSDGKILWIREANLAETKPEAMKELKALEAPGWKTWEELQALGQNKAVWTAGLVAKGMSATEAGAKVGMIRSIIGEKGSPWWPCFESHVGITRPGWRTDYGYTMCTPVTDGKHVWVKFGTGVLACYDMEGNRKWMTNTGYWNMHSPSVSSPVLVGNTLIAQLTADPRNAADERNLLIGFDAGTGKTNWVQKVRRRSASTATPVPMRLSNGKETVDVVVDSCGYVVRVDDGKLLMGQIGVHELWGTPLPIGDTLFFGSQLGWRALIRLIMIDRDTVGCKFEWYFLDYRGYRQHGSYAVYDDGTIYTWEDHSGCVFDYTTGAFLKSFAIVRRAQPWPPPALAGRHLFLPGKGGGVTVCEVRREATKMIAFSDWEGGNAGPVFEGDRVYLRGRSSLWCIGYTGEAGKKYEEEHLKQKAEEAKNPPAKKK
jgi:outer membrane protein assembly factor BamB